MTEGSGVGGVGGKFGNGMGGADGGAGDLLGLRIGGSFLLKAIAMRRTKQLRSGPTFLIDKQKGDLHASPCCL